MASISEILVGVASDTAAKSGSGLASAGSSISQGIQNYSQLAELAARKEQLEQQKAQAAQQAKQLESAKLDKFVSAIDKGSSLKGSARSNYYNKVLPQYRDALGLTNTFPNESLQFATSSPETLSRVQTIIADVRSGKITEQQGIALFNDPVSMMGVKPTYDEATAAVEEIQKASEFALSKAATKENTQIAASAARAKANEGVDNAAEKKSNEKIGEEHGNYMAVGGSATMNSNVRALNKLADEVEKLDIGAGTKAASYSPFGKKALQDVVNPKLSAIRNQVEAIGVTNLKATFGGNPTEGEREALLSTLFPTGLGPKEIAKRLRQEAAKTQQTIKDKEAQFKRLNLSTGAAPAQDKAARYKELLSGAKTQAEKQKIIDSAKRAGVSLGGD